MSERYPIEVLCLRSAKGHRYEARPISRRSASWGTLVEDDCTRCGSERIRTIDSLGDISVRRYEESPAYRAVLDMNLSTGDARLALLWWLRRDGDA